MCAVSEDELIGMDLEGFVVEREIGRGGMGVVFVGTDTTLKRPVAIKVLPRESVDDPEMVKRFEREAKALAGLNHPNVAQVYRFGTVRGTPYYVMEYISGKSLAEILEEKGRIGGSACVDIMIQAARGLQAAAEHQIIHRDVKPANIMVTDDGGVKILDFGIAKNFGDETFKTMTGLIVGTPRYMSPEQGRGRTVDLRSDIYSLGATFYHVVTGHPPFDSPNPVTLIAQHCTDPVRAIEEINANVPQKLCNVIYGMMEKSPADRFQEYTQLILALENVSRKDGDVSLTYSYLPDEASGRAAGKSEKLGNIKYVWAGIALFLVLAALGLLFAPEPAEEPPPVAATPPSSPGVEPPRKMSDTIDTLLQLKAVQDALDAENREKKKQ